MKSTKHGKFEQTESARRQLEYMRELDMRLINLTTMKYQFISYW